jgi:hypothetical protein
VVRDANRQALAYMYFEKEPRRRFRRELLTRDEAQRIAAVFAKLPELFLCMGQRQSAPGRARCHLLGPCVAGLARGLGVPG